MKVSLASNILSKLQCGLFLVTLLVMASTPATIATCAPATTPAEENYHLLITRYREVLLAGTLLDAAKLKGWSAALGAEGRWPDIDYQDQQKAGWKTSQHLVRVKDLSRALADPKSPLFNDAKTESITLRALDHWIAQRYKNPNWWHNDIGVPMLMRDIIVLLGNRLQGKRLQGALEVLHQYGRAKPGDGANTLWMAELALIYGALTGDAALVAGHSRMISDEIKISTGEGIQSDFSYYQHGPRLQQFHYGGSFIHDAARLGWQLRGTPWAIPEEKLQIIAGCVLQGGQWMIRGGYTVPSTLDRAVSRENSLKTGAQLTAVRYLRETLPQQAAALDAYLARQEGRGAPLVGFRAFPRSDFTTYHRPNFSFFLKTISNRTLPAESINNENLKGHLLNCGDHYLLSTGPEYHNLQPVWDWDQLPGVTWAKDAGEVQRQPFVGAVSDGTSGATAMDYRFAGQAGQSLVAHKFWTCHGDQVICLISGLSTSQVAGPVRTALDQCLLRGPVTVSDDKNAIKVLSAGSHDLLPVRWIHHAGLVYVPLGQFPVTLRLGPVTGAWSDINTSGSREPVTQPVFQPLIEHGAQPNGQNSGYAILSSPTAQQAAKLVAQPAWQVLRNDAAVQAVRFADGTTMAAFYEAGKLERDGQPLLAVDQPCLIFGRNGEFRVCDPTHKGGVIRVTAGRKPPVAIKMPDGGQTSALVRM